MRRQAKQVAGKARLGHKEGKEGGGEGAVGRDRPEPARRRERWGGVHPRARGRGGVAQGGTTNCRPGRHPAWRHRSGVGRRRQRAARTGASGPDGTKDMRMEDGGVGGGGGGSGHPAAATGVTRSSLPGHWPRPARAPPTAGRGGGGAGRAARRGLPRGHHPPRAAAERGRPADGHCRHANRHGCRGGWATSPCGGHVGGLGGRRGREGHGGGGGDAASRPTGLPRAPRKKEKGGKGTAGAGKVAAARRDGATWNAATPRNASPGIRTIRTF